MRRVAFALQSLAKAQTRFPYRYGSIVLNHDKKFLVGRDSLFDMRVILDLQSFASVQCQTFHDTTYIMRQHNRSLPLLHNVPCQMTKIDQHCSIGILEDLETLCSIANNRFLSYQQYSIYSQIMLSNHMHGCLSSQGRSAHKYTMIMICTASSDRRITHLLEVSVLISLSLFAASLLLSGASMDYGDV